MEKKAATCFQQIPEISLELSSNTSEQKNYIPYNKHVLTEPMTGSNSGIYLLNLKLNKFIFTKI